MLTEAEEQANFVQYLKLKGLDHFRVPNETYTKSWKQKRANKMLGVSAGVPDLFIIVDNRLIAIEMKRQKGGTVTANQKKWLDILNNAGVPAYIARGCGQAIEIIESIQKAAS